jgi:transposase
MNYFSSQGKATPDSVREAIVEKWLNGTAQAQIGREVRLSRQTVSNIINNFIRNGHCNAGKGGNYDRLARTNNLNIYIEYCKKQRPSTYGFEIQNKLLEDKVCLPENLPSLASISRCLTKDLGYSYKKLSVIPRESQTPEAEEKLIQYLTSLANTDPRTIHFFDECSVVKTTGNRHYGHAAVGKPAVEVMRYASNATLTVNLLHNMYGVGHVNLLPGPSNGLELLNCFAEALEEEDYFGNALLKVGDTIIMDNCGFHHARNTEPVLRDMLAAREINLIFQPPYHPQYNTCEMCFRQLKGCLRKYSKFAEIYTEAAIFHGLSTITPTMSQNFFAHCGYI